MNKEEFRKRVIEHLDDYIVEAENQEGPEYWNMFPNVIEDFGQYLLEVDAD